MKKYQIKSLRQLGKSRIMTLIIGSVAGISLVVGGIGVMNIMLVSVTERTRKIGIHLALGATRRQILTRFLIKSITLTLIGGVLGIFLGWIVVTLISLFGVCHLLYLGKLSLVVWSFL